MSEQWKEIDEGREFGWDDEIKNDGPDYVLLPDGEYPFEVTKFERGRFAGSAKLPPCNMAKLTIRIDGGDKGQTSVIQQLFLHTKMGSKNSSFFVSIGQAKLEDEIIRPRWNEVVGAKGRCRVGIHEWRKKDGTPGTSNEIARFLPPVEPTAAPAAGWTQGRF